MDYSDQYDPDNDFDSWYTSSAAAVIAPMVRPADRVLELGCATGAMTAELVSRGAWVLAIEHSHSYLCKARHRVPDNAEFVEAKLDSWNPSTADGHFNHVIATNVLHEVDDPLRLLTIARSVLAPGGLVHLSLQNPGSLHRRVGWHMKLVDDIDQLSPLGVRLGSHGVWNARQLTRMAENAGLRCLLRRGLMLKPLPNRQMSQLPRDILRGFAEAAIEFPDLGAMSFLLLCAS